MICARDELPGSGDIRTTDIRWVPIVPLPARLPFLFDDTTPPAAPALTSAAVGKTVQLTATWPQEPDIAGFEVFRSSTPGGLYTQLNSATLLTQPGFFDLTAPLGVPSYYVMKTVDTSGNESAPSNEVSVTPS